MRNKFCPNKDINHQAIDWVFFFAGKNKRIMAFKQRHSKFKHVKGEPFKKDKCYDNVKISKSPWDSNKSDVNGKFLAVILESQGGGAFTVLPLSQTGRMDINHPKISGHKSPILDLAFNPFNENEIASASEDCMVKIWEIPDGGLTSNISECKMDLEGHQRKVGALAWHPTAENVLASGGADGVIFIWNTETAEPMYQLDDLHPDIIYCLSWNYNGSLLASSCKDKNVRVIDPRKGIIISEGQCHAGAKPTRVTFCGTYNFVATCGFSRSNERQFGIYRQDNLSSSLATETLDNGSGTIFSFFDEDTKMVYFIGKGDGQMRYYEILDESPYVQALSMYQHAAPQIGVCPMPKRFLDHKACEVMRFFKLHNKGLVEPIQMIVPRKSGMFQDDIFPPCYAGSPAMSADEWQSGTNKPPVLVTITKDGLGGETSGKKIAPVSASGKLSKQSSHSSTSSGRGRTPERESSPSPAVITGSAEADEENRRLRSKVHDLESENKELRAQLREKEDTLSQIKKILQ